MNGWKKHKLGDVCHLVRGPFGGSLKKSIFVPDGYAVYEQQHAINNQFESIRYFIRYDKFEEMKRFQVLPGDLIMSCSGTMGKVAKVPTDVKKGIINQALLKITPNENLNADFLNYYMISPNFQEQLALNTQGVAIKNVASVKVLKEIQLPLPPLEDQKRIVAILDEAFEGIEKAQANAEKNLANVAELFDSELNTTFLSDRRDWTRYKLSELTTKIGSGATPKGGKKSYKLEGISLIRSLNVHDRTFLMKNLAFLDDAQAGKLSNVTIEEDDVLFNITGASVARCCVVPDHVLPARVNQHVSILRPIQDKLLPDFLCYLMTSKIYKDLLLGIGEAGATRQAITKKQLEDFAVQIPDSLDEQKVFIEKLDKAASLTQRLEVVYQEKLKDLAELKQSLLEKAFSGELTASNVIAFTRPVENQKQIETISPEFAADVLAFGYHWHASQGRDMTFGRVKGQKLLQLAESVAKADMGRQPIKDAAGPNDFKHMLRAEDWAKENQFFEFAPRLTGHGYDFKKMGDYGKLIDRALAAIEAYREKLEKILSILLPMDTQEAEVLATVHAAWNNLLLDGIDPTEDAIIIEARENWHGDKLKIPRHKFQDAIKTIRSNDIVPDGTAKRVTGQEIMRL